VCHVLPNIQYCALITLGLLLLVIIIIITAGFVQLLETPGKSWNLIFKFSRSWKLLEKDLSPGNSCKTRSKIHLRPSEMAKIFFAGGTPCRRETPHSTPTRSTAFGRVRPQSRRLSRLRHFDNWKVPVSQNIHNSVVDAF
jgi:hypothetical protein